MRIRGSELRICLVTGQPPGFTPRAISQNGQNRKFSACRALEKAAGTSSTRKVPGPKLKTEIVRRVHAMWEFTGFPGFPAVARTAATPRSTGWGVPRLWDHVVKTVPAKFRHNGGIGVPAGDNQHHRVVDFPQAGRDFFASHPARDRQIDPHGVKRAPGSFRFLIKLDRFRSMAGARHLVAQPPQRPRQQIRWLLADDITRISATSCSEQLLASQLRRLGVWASSQAGR